MAGGTADTVKSALRSDRDNPRRVEIRRASRDSNVDSPHESVRDGESSSGTSLSRSISVNRSQSKRISMTQSWGNLEPDHYRELHEGQAAPKRDRTPSQ